MTSILTDIKRSFQEGNLCIKLIYINVAVFVLVRGSMTIMELCGYSAASIIEWIAMPASLGAFIVKPWSVLTYMFLHYDFIHLILNLFGLYGFGRLFLIFFHEKQLVGIYILGGIMGAIFYLLAYNTFPYFEPYKFSILLGASGSILAIMAATATIAPNFEVQLVMLGNIKFKYLALFWMVIDMLSVTSLNAGGHIAHLGGIFLGFLFAFCYKRRTDITLPISFIFDSLANFFSHKKTKFKIKKKPVWQMSDQEYNKMRHDEDLEIDKILDKIKKSGYNSLTDNEKAMLFKIKN